MSTTTTTSGGSTTDELKQKASHAAGAAADEGKQVASSAVDHAASFAERAWHELEDQSREQGGRVAELLRGVGEDLDAMSGASTGRSPAGGIARSLSSAASHWADRLDRDGLGAVASELGDQGRRRPVTFLAASLAAGVAAGRLMRNADTARIAEAARGDNSSDGPSGGGAPSAGSPQMATAGGAAPPSGRGVAAGPGPTTPGGTR